MTIYAEYGQSHVYVVVMIMLCSCFILYYLSLWQYLLEHMFFSNTIEQGVTKLLHCYRIMDIRNQEGHVKSVSSIKHAERTA